MALYTAIFLSMIPVLFVEASNRTYEPDHHICEIIVARDWSNLHFQGFATLNNEELLLLIESDNLYKVQLGNSKYINRIRLPPRPSGKWYNDSVFLVNSEITKESLLYMQQLNFVDKHSWLYLTPNHTAFFAFMEQNTISKTTYTLKHRLIVDNALNGYLFYIESDNRVAVVDTPALFHVKPVDSIKSSLLSYYTERVNKPNSSSSQDYWSIWVLNKEVLFVPHTVEVLNEVKSFQILPVGFVRKHVTYLLDTDNSTVTKFNFTYLVSDRSFENNKPTLVLINREVVDMEAFFDCSIARTAKGTLVKPPVMSSAVYAGIAVVVVLILVVVIGLLVWKRKSIVANLNINAASVTKNATVTPINKEAIETKKEVSESIPKSKTTATKKSVSKKN